MKRPVRLVIAGIAAGALVAGSSVVGAILDPIVNTTSGDDTPPTVTAEEVLATVTASDSDVAPGDDELTPEEIAAIAGGSVTAPTGELPAGTFLVGAARASLFPTPEPWGGTQWQKEGCTTYGTEGFGGVNQDHALPSSPDDVRGWPAASPDCVYLGGFGLGPVRPAQAVDDGGVWVRALAISNGKETFAYAIADTVGWFARYDSNICTDCGILDVRERLATDLGLGAENVGNIAVGSTHTHAGGDTYGGWGGIPDWYRAQLRDAAIAAVKQSVANMAPAQISVGEVQLRDSNNQRRDNYYSTADTGATWLQAKTLPQTVCEGKKKRETCEPTQEVITTWSTFAGHPTIVGDPILHADWPGAAARGLEATYGGVGVMFEGGLGNVSISGRGGANDDEKAENTGVEIAKLLAADIEHNPTLLQSNEMRAAVEVVEHPVMTNAGLTTLGTVGLFDREFAPNTKGASIPGTYVRKGNDNGDTDRPTFDTCASAGLQVRTTAGAHRIGEFVVAFGPGELFSNITEAVKEHIDRTAVTMVLGQTNDALGYIIQSFEFDRSTNVVTHYGAGTSHYEEVFSLDHCLGDHILDTLLASGRAVQG